MSMCRSTAGLQFPDAAALAMPTYSNTGGGNPVQQDAGSMHEIALRAVLVQQCNWYGTLSHVVGKGDEGNAGVVVSLGPEQCVPPSLTRRLGPRLVNFSALEEDRPQLPPSISALDPEMQSMPQQRHSTAELSTVDDDAIAVVGMSIKVAGADDVNEFSQMLQTGESQHEPIGPDRIRLDTLFRDGDSQPSPTYYGNFVRDKDAFDHKFFKRSPRESATTDPQQRLFMQAAYHAVEQSGYFTETTTTIASGVVPRNKTHVGVYVGSCAGDYEHHTACHPPNAFGATGVMRSFVPGKVSHYFGVSMPHGCIVV